MPLPDNPKMPWPPESWKATRDAYAECDAWYSGDPIRLSTVYGGKLWNAGMDDFFTKYSIGGINRSRFWGRQVQAERRTMLHVPIAGDISQTSASMLFSESPKIKIPEADGESPDQDAIKAQKRLDEIINECNVLSLLSEAAETASAMGGVVVKVNWDGDLLSMPILNVVQADDALPEFSYGILTACTCWKVLSKENDKWWRLLERHEKGVILYGLYEGTAEVLGDRRPLTAHPDAAHLKDVVDTGIDDLLCRYIPNMRPNRKDRRAYLGQSDYAGSEGLMDSLDETYTSLMRDIRLGVGRLILPESMIDKDGAFDLDKEAYVAVNAISDAASGMKDQITLNQFEIRTEQHLRAATELEIKIFTNAGYSPQSFGLNVEGKAESGTALNIRERKSFMTSAKKAGYWKTPLEDLLFLMLQVDAEHLKSGIKPFRPTVEMQDSVQTDLLQIATSVEMIERARAASTETKVRYLHPDWSSEQVLDEAKKIDIQQGALVQDPAAFMNEQGAAQ